MRVRRAGTAVQWWLAAAGVSRELRRGELRAFGGGEFHVGVRPGGTWRVSHDSELRPWASASRSSHGVLDGPEDPRGPLLVRRGLGTNVDSPQLQGFTATLEHRQVGFIHKFSNESDSLIRFSTPW